MTPDDPRHGTYAGAQAHWRAGETLAHCPPCANASYRHTKRRRYEREILGIRGRIPLGARAWRIVNAQQNMAAFGRETGLDKCGLYRILRKGPTGLVLRDTQRRILAAGTPITVVGLRRRLQALAVLGYGGQWLADHYGGSPWAFNLIRADNSDRRMVKTWMRERITAAFDDLHMTPAPEGRSARKTRTHAVAQGWVGSLAWDDIDDPREQPKGAGAQRRRSPGDIDWIVVDRILDGHRVPESTRAEREAALAEWLALGKTETSLCAVQGWKSGRYAKGRAA